MAGRSQGGNGKKVWQSGDETLKVVLAAHEIQAVLLARLREAGTPGVVGALIPPESKMPPNPEAEWVSPEAAQIIAVLTDEYQTAAEVALRLGRVQSRKDRVPDDVRFILNEYSCRKVIDRSNDGYRLWPVAEGVGSGP